MTTTIWDKIKLGCEIAAYGFGAVFLATKFVGGQANAGMEVSIELIRREDSEVKDRDNLAVIVKLKRSDVGRLQLEDVVLEVSELSSAPRRPVYLRDPSIIAERDRNGRQIEQEPSNRGTALPPGDATQLAYFVRVKRGVPILVDATILATRTGPWFDRPQWRASSVALPPEPPKSASAPASASAPKGAA